MPEARAHAKLVTLIRNILSLHSLEDDDHDVAACQTNHFSLLASEEVEAHSSHHDLVYNPSKPYVPQHASCPAGNANPLRSLLLKAPRQLEERSC